MKVKPHYWHDHLGGWDFDFNVKLEVDIPDEIVEAYFRAEKEYIKACDAVREAVNYAKTTKDRA